ncbi:uncharacterized protein LOC134261013 [Saccostrea cucullata]
MKTGKAVNFCPEDVESMRLRSKEKMCEDMHDSCTEDPLVYHCVRFGNRLIEVCAPRNFITGNCCVQFNEGVGRIVEDYNVPCSECPFHYYSNESLTYQTCFQSIKSMAILENSIESTFVVTSKSLTTAEPSPRSMSSSPSRNRTKCRSASGRHKRQPNKNCKVSTTNAYAIQSNKTTKASNNNTRPMGDADFTIMMVLVVVAVLIIIGIGTVLLNFKGIPKHKLFLKNYKTDQPKSERSRESPRRKDNYYIPARNDEPE